MHTDAKPLLKACTWYSVDLVKVLMFVKYQLSVPH